VAGTKRAIPHPSQLPCPSYRCFTAAAALPFISHHISPPLCTVYSRPAGFPRRAPCGAFGCPPSRPSLPPGVAGAGTGEATAHLATSVTAWGLRSAFGRHCLGVVAFAATICRSLGAATCSQVDVGACSRRARAAATPWPCHAACHVALSTVCSKHTQTFASSLGGAQACGMVLQQTLLGCVEGVDGLSLLHPPLFAAPCVALCELCWLGIRSRCPSAIWWPLSVRRMVEWRHT
jgi:hypothetical protein